MQTADRAHTAQSEAIFSILLTAVSRCAGKLVAMLGRGDGEEAAGALGIIHTA